MTALLLAMSVVAAPSLGPWKSVGSEDGVRLYERTIQGRDLPRIRGVLDIDASVFQLLAVLADLDRACEWNSRCLESRILERKGLTRVVFYHHTDFPWPVSDRDVVLVTQVTGHESGHDITAAFLTTTHAKRPAKDDVVRIGRMRGHFRLKRLAPARTRVIYELDADPGGWLPDWVVAWITRGIPSATLTSLADYERQHRLRYAPFVQEHDPAFRQEPPP